MRNSFPMSNSNAVNSNEMIQSNTDSGEVNVGDFLSALWESRWLVVAVTALATVFGLVYAIVATPIFRSDILVQVEERDVSTKNLTGDLAPLLGNSSATTAEIEILRSRTVIGEAVSSLNLQYEVEPKYFPGFGKWIAKRSENLIDGAGLAKPFLGLSTYAWGGEKIQIESFNAPLGASTTSKWTLRAEDSGRYTLLDALNQKVLEGKVGTSAKGNGAAINISTLRARTGTEFRIDLSTSLEAISALQASLGVIERGKQSGIINASLEGANAVKISAILNAIGESYVRLNINRKSAEAEKTLNFLDEQLPALKKELDASEERFNKYRIRSGTIDLTEEAKLILKQAVDSTQSLLELQQKRMELVQRFMPAHPSVIAVDNQISAIQRQNELLKSSIGRLPATQQDALRLTRDVTVNNQLYTSLLNTAQQLRVLKAGKIGNVRLVDYAVPGERPIQPRRTLILAGSVLAGLFLGLLLAIVKKLMFGGVESSDEIERATSIPVLAAIPHSDGQRLIEEMKRKSAQGMNLLAHNSPQDLTVESLRSLRTALQFAMLDAVNNLVMITGPAPGVGKSFVSANLAAVLAASGKRVLLIDCDLRRGHLHEFFGLTRVPGLSSLVNGELVLSDVLHHDVLPGLDFLSTGATAPNPAELLGGSLFSNLLQEFGDKYDLILVDTPPILAVTDAAIVGKHMGTTILNLRHGKHTMAEIQESVKRLHLSGVNVKGMLLNAIPRRSLAYGRYRYDGAYYNYDYNRPRKNTAW